MLSRITTILRRNNTLFSSQYKTFDRPRLVPKPQIVKLPEKNFSDQIGDNLTLSQINGFDHLHNQRLNKGLAFSIEERQALAIHGLQPPTVRTQEEQVKLCKMMLDNFNQPLNKLLYLYELRERNEKLHFRLLDTYIEELLPIVYTPTIGIACAKFDYIYRSQRCMFITIHDKGHIYDVLKNWPEPKVMAIVVTDGERILGLGDLGVDGVGISVGKLGLYTTLAGIKPHHCLPICLDVGTDNEQLRENPAYMGLRMKRVRGKAYDDFMDEFMAAVVERFGQDTLIQFEDFGTRNAARLLQKYRDKYCTFNDDIQGTGAVSVAGLYASNRLTGKKIADHRVMFFGAGTAALGIADLIFETMLREGKDKEEAKKAITLFDINGLVTKNRKNLQGNQVLYAKDGAEEKDFLKAIQQIKPSVLIGVSTKGGAFTPDILKEMAKNNERPIVFAMSNPTSNVECTPQDAYDHTEGRVIFCTGSPFPEIKYNNQIFKTGQGNNSYIFPGVALGVVLGEIHHIPDDFFLIAARTVADAVTDEDLKRGSLFPPLKKIYGLSTLIAVRILEYSYEKKIANHYPEPKDKRKYVESMLYNFHYTSAVPKMWEYPKVKPFI